MRKIERFDKYMNINKLNDNQVTVNCGLSVGLLGKARRGDSDLGDKAIEKILSFYQDINRVWLLTGEGEMLRESHSTSPVGNAATSADKSEMQQTQGSPAPTTENITNLIAITREAMAVIREQSAQMNRLITQVELSNARYDRLFASISGVSTGFPATPTDLGVKNPPPIKSELK